MLNGVMLRIVYDLQGFGIAATDGETGSVEHFYFGDEQWTLEEGPDIEEAIVSPQWIAAVNWAQSKGGINLSSEEVRQCPEHVPGRPLHRPDIQTGYLLN